MISMLFIEWVFLNVYDRITLLCYVERRLPSLVLSNKLLGSKKLTGWLLSQCECYTSKLWTPIGVMGIVVSKCQCAIPIVCNISSGSGCATGRDGGTYSRSGTMDIFIFFFPCFCFEVALCLRDHVLVCAKVSPGYLYHLFALPCLYLVAVSHLSPPLSWPTSHPHPTKQHLTFRLKCWSQCEGCYFLFSSPSK